MNRVLLLVAAAALLLAGSGAIWMAANMNRTPVASAPLASKPHQALVPPPRAKKDVPEGWLTEFTLTERSGKPVSTKDLEGKVWAASFFFADCPGECHQQNLAIGAFQKEFGPKGVTFVSITVNPERDTPERLRDYASKYTSSPDQWLFLTGDLTYIRRIGAEMFSVAVDKGTHGSRLILVDKWGNIRGYHSTNATAFPEEYASIRPQLRKLLAETEPPAEFRVEGSSGDSAHQNAPADKTAPASAEAPASDEASQDVPPESP
jgi:cytochrome oxidase Cu insertion factor (SCO1/SenC/PrrC family)